MLLEFPALQVRPADKDFLDQEDLRARGDNREGQVELALLDDLASTDSRALLVTRAFPEVQASKTESTLCLENISGPLLAFWRRNDSDDHYEDAVCFCF